jgi:hypothetical protein
MEPVIPIQKASVSFPWTFSQVFSPVHDYSPPAGLEAAKA